MLRAAVKAATPLGNEAKAFMDAGELVPDHLVIAMLKERISQPDCLEHGWLLDGFPRTSVQALALDDAGIHPAAVILLDVPDDVLIQRVVGRRLDPVTGNIYHNTFSPPTDPEVATRLIQRSDDTEEKARLRLSTYYSHTQSIQAHYSAVLKKVDGNRNKTQVFTDLSQIIDASLASDHDDTPTSTPSAPSSSDSTPSSDVTESTKSVPVAEFVRRAEEAYEKGVLLENDVNWSGQATAESSQDSGTSNYYDLFRRLDLVIGDLIAFLSFAYIGRIVHGQPAIDLDLFKTAAPFCIAWLLASPLLGVYTRGATANISTAIKTFSKSWAVAVPMGIGLHGMFFYYAFST